MRVRTESSVQQLPSTSVATSLHLTTSQLLANFHLPQPSWKDRMLAHDGERDNDVSGGGGSEGSVTYDEADPNWSTVPGQNSVLDAILGGDCAEEPDFDMDQSADGASDRAPLVADVSKPVPASARKLGDTDANNGTPVHVPDAADSMEGAGLHLHDPHGAATEADGVNSVRGLDIQDVQLTNHLKTVRHGPISWNIYRFDEVDEEGVVKLGRDKNSLFARPNKKRWFCEHLGCKQHFHSRASLFHHLVLRPTHRFFFQPRLLFLVIPVRPAKWAQSDGKIKHYIKLIRAPENGGRGRERGGGSGGGKRRREGGGTREREKRETIVTRQKQTNKDKENNKKEEGQTMRVWGGNHDQRGEDKEDDRWEARSHRSRGEKGQRNTMPTKRGQRGVTGSGPPMVRVTQVEEN